MSRAVTGAGRLALLVAGAAALAGCAAARGAATVDTGSASGLHGTDVSDVITRPRLALADTAGRLVDLHTRPSNELTVLFFGYTHCRDVCPTTMADLAAARRSLPANVRARVKVFFVTEDPARDTPSVLRSWLERYDDSFVGLIGGGRRTQAALDALKSPHTEIHPVVASAGSAGPAAAPLVEHGASVYVFSASKSELYTGGTTPTQYASDLRSLAGS
jgi:protein SCO1/2